MNYFKIDKIVLMGEIKGGNVNMGDQMMLDHDINVSGGNVITKDGNDVTIVYETLKKNMFDEDITPTIEYFVPNHEKDEEEGTFMESFETLQPPRKAKDDEYDTLNNYNKKLEFRADKHFYPLEEGDIEEIENQKLMEGYEDINRDEVSVIDVTEDFKIILHNYSTVSVWSNGSRTVNWGVDRYSLKYGVLYPYDVNQESDDVEVDISEIL